MSRATAPAEPAVESAQRVRPLRADAQRNRDKVMEVAAVAFGERGETASLEDIARRAGVGIGTLYRHFSTREALLEAVYRREVDQLCDAAPELIATLPPYEALHEWLRRFVAYAATKKGWAGALKAALGPNSDVFAHSRNRMIEALELLINTNVDAGLMRADVSAEDVLRAIGALCHTVETPDWQEVTTRLAGLFLDGLRYGAPAGR
ncbi:MAG: TetR/AcrR family transcriptional regulator [Jatrophihabitans sp.]